MMRAWGRVYDATGSVPIGPWQEVTTDANGENGNFYLTALCQVLRLNLGEDPLNYIGVPGLQSVNAQQSPDYWVMLIQQQYAAYFASLIITRIQSIRNPTYTVRAVTFSGTILTATVAQ
jgi:hypothetical protein